MMVVVIREHLKFLMDYEIFYAAGPQQLHHPPGLVQGQHLPADKLGRLRAPIL